MLSSPHHTDPLSGFDVMGAMAEGWTLSCCGTRDDGCARIELQKVDNPSDGHVPFAADHDAWAFVVQQARQGSSLHRDALMHVDSIERALIESAVGAI